MFGFKEFFGKPQRYLAHKDGRAVSVCISSKDLDSLMLIFERRIEQSDVVNGKLVPVSSERVKRRGGKRKLVFKLSYEGAEDLHRLLGQALKDTRHRRRARDFFERMFTVVNISLMKEYLAERREGHK